MDFRWYTAILYGFISGLTDILPVSSQAHRILLLKFLGEGSEPALMRLFINLGILAALYYSCQNHIIKMIRAKKLSRIPKRRRKRPLDTRSLMDLSLLKTMVIPVIIVFIFYDKLVSHSYGMIWVAVFMLINGVILYVPQFFPGGNRDSRTLSRVQGFMIGLGGSASVIPGCSGLGVANSIGSVCGMDRSYGLNMTLLMNMAVCIGFSVFDILSMVSIGTGNIGFGSLVMYLLSGIAAFGGAFAGIRGIRFLASSIGYSVFAYYCWGVALFTFIMNLLA